MFVINLGTDLRNLEVRDYSIRHCDFAVTSDGPVLRILDAIYLEDLETVNFWCQFPELADYYGQLELRSIHRDNLDLRELYESRYDLVLAKPEMISGAGGHLREGIGYELIAQYPDYGSQLVSLRGTPELNAAWMKGKTLGLLDDPNSVSAYQIPKAALKNHDLGEDPDIVYFRTYRELYRALFEGEVDVIASILSDEGPDSALQLPPGLVLAQDIPGAGWYADRELLNTPRYCALLRALEQLAKNSRIDYFRDMRIVKRCAHDD